MILHFIYILSVFGFFSGSELNVEGRALQYGFAIIGYFSGVFYSLILNSVLVIILELLFDKHKK